MVVIHEDRKDHVCKHCGEAFALEEILKRHMTSKHLGGRKITKCEICKKVFKYEDVYEKHVVRCKKFENKCEHCEKVFKQASQLRWIY